jgi:MFS family permease
MLGGTTTMLSLCVALFSVGRLISAPLLGWLSGKWVSNFTILSGSIVICFVGNLLYAFAYQLGLTTLVVSRVLLGFGTGILGVVRAYVSLITTTEERTAYMSLLNAVQFVGFSVTPLLGSLLCLKDFKLGKVEINCLTAPGFLLALLNALMLLVFLVLFREPPSASTSTTRSASKGNGDDEASRLLKDDSWESGEEVRYPWIGPGIFILLNGVVRASLSVLETIGGIMFRRVWYHQELTNPDPGSDTTVDQETETTGYFFTVVGGIGIITYIAIAWWSKRISDFVMLILGLLSLGLGSIALVKIGEHDFARFSIGCLWIWSLGMPLTATSVVSMASKIITRTQQARVMGLITAAGSIGRILGPLVTDLPETWCFSVVVLIVTLSLLLCFTFRSRLVPPTTSDRHG